VSAARPRARLWLYRALALVAVPLLFFLGLEGLLHLMGYGRATGFLVPDEKPGTFRSNPDFVSSFLPGTFDLRPLNFRVALPKPAGTLRVVVLGESAAQGIPVPAFGFAAQLRAQLRARYPGREVEVLNTGIVAINSHVVYQVARQLATFSPDLFVVYLGNNEVVGPYGPGCAYLSEMPPLWAIRLSIFVRSTRTGQLVNALVGRLARARGRPPEWGGMAMFVNSAVTGDDPRLEAVYANFEANLRDIVHVASGAGAKVILCTVAGNLRDCAPFLSRHRLGLSPADLAAWTRSFDRGRLEWLLGRPARARADLAAALRLDPEFADASFLLGTVETELGDTAAARQQFVDAEHWDALRFRPDARINDAVRRVARDAGGKAALLDAALMLGADPESAVAPSGRGLFLEHVHLDWAGNYLLGRAMAEQAEAALGPREGSASWLDSAACAEVVGYTPHERRSVLQHIATIIQNPPFTNQLTYAEDEARLAGELAAARLEQSDPGNLERAARVVRAAEAHDPGNADLPKLAEDIADDRGDLPGALDAARRAERLQPRNFALTTDEAIKLSRMDRTGEAEALLRATLATCPDRDRPLMAPAFADLYTRTHRFQEGRRYLDGEIARAPRDLSLRLLRGRMELLGGDAAAAEREDRSVLAEDPANKGALEALVTLLGQAGRSADAERVVLDAAGRQPGNAANNLRAAILCDQHGDRAKETEYLLAAERSGPVSSSIELQIARWEFAQQHPDEGLAHLALAQRVAAYEGNPAVSAQIGQAIEQVLVKIQSLPPG